MDLYQLGNAALNKMLIARGVASRTEVIDGTPLHYYRVQGKGSGPPVLLLHGLGSNAHAFFRLFFPLARDFSEIWAPDLPGNGLSPLPPDGPPSMEANVRTLAAFIEQKIGKKVWLIGTSLGGAMSFYLAHHAAKHVSALGVIAPAGAKFAPERFEQMVRSFKLESNRDAREIARRLYDRAPLGVVLFAPKLFKAIYGSAAVQAALKEVKPGDSVPEEMLGGLQMPVLLVWGRSEKLLPYESIDYFRAHLPRSAEIHEVTGFGHVPQMERPKQLLSLLRGFARRQGLIA